MTFKILYNNCIQTNSALFSNRIKIKKISSDYARRRRRGIWILFSWPTRIRQTPWTACLQGRLITGSFMPCRGRDEDRTGTCTLVSTTFFNLCTSKLVGRVQVLKSLEILNSIWAYRQVLRWKELVGPFCFDLLLNVFLNTNWLFLRLPIQRLEGEPHIRYGILWIISHFWRVTHFEARISTISQWTLFNMIFSRLFIKR